VRGKRIRGPGRRGKFVVRPGLSFRVYLGVPGAGPTGSHRGQPQHGTPEFTREVKFAPSEEVASDEWRVASNSRVKMACRGNDRRDVAVERHAVRCSNLP
jgi:hypothetical protein